MPSQPSSSEPLSISQITKYLQDQNLISEATAQTIITTPKGKKQTQQHPVETIADAQVRDEKNEALSLDMLITQLSDWSGQPVYHIDPLKIDVQKIANVMSFAFAKRHQILALEISSTEVTIASAQPFITEWEADLKHVLKKEIKRVIVDPVGLRKFTVEFYELANNVNQAGALTDSQYSQNFEQMLELGAKDASPDANDSHIVNIVDWLLQYAFDQRASDIHIEPRREIAQVRFRIDGVLHNVYEFPAKVGIAVTSRFKILGRLNVAEKRKPQDGRIKTRNKEEREIELRLSTLPTAFGEKLVMRVFDPEVLQCSFADLGFSAEDLRRWNDMISKPNGIILVTGPTGSGKTTTLYSTLKELATSEVNVSTIEDPIEMVEPAFNQMQIQQAIDLDFATGIKALMRQDPDIIMIGEIRDLETAEMATQAALTGHLVLTTLHTNDAPSAITRLMELGIPPYLIRATVLGVMAQRLVRTLCSSCKKSVDISDEDWTMITKPWKTPLPTNSQQPVGCLECRDTGYKGRAGVYEIMPVSESIKEHIHERGSISEMRKQAIKEGMHSLRLSGANKIAKGHTTIDEVLRVTPVSLQN